MIADSSNNSHRPVAYLNETFLESPDARGLRILSEYLEPLSHFRDEKIQDTIVFFGSARISEEGPLGRYYRDARTLARLVTEWTSKLESTSHRFVICSGGGPGIMEAANRGASDAGGKNIGLNIGLPFEQRPNPFITPELSFEFHYFFMRKFWFAYLAKALVIFPGGFGTMDELFEILTLAQTQKQNRNRAVRHKILARGVEFRSAGGTRHHRSGRFESVSVRRRSRNRAWYLAGAVDQVFPGAGEAPARSGARNSRDRQVARVKHSIQSVWKRAGKVEKTFAAALILYLILLATWPGSGFETIVAFVTFVLGAWIALRLLRLGLRKLTWSLRNRLMVAYLFIAVLPILLVLMLVGLGAYILAGQVAVYLVRSELDRRLVSLRSVAQDLSLSQANIQQVGETDQQRFPGLILWVRQNGVAKRWPPNADVSLPASLAANSRGLALRNDRYYAWADVVAGDQQVLALAPLSPRYLSTMMPALGDVYFTRLGAGDEGALSPAGGEAPRTALSPPVNQLDIPVRWGSLMQAVDWGRPERTETALLVGYARLSSILTTILSQSSDELGGAVLVFFYAVAVAFLIVAVAGLAIGISMSRSITGAVHSLYEGTERVMRGDFSHLIGVSGRDQLAELSGSFNTMTKNLERLLVVAKEKERMEAEIEIARGVQDQLYPKAPPVFESLQVLGCCHPARMVSGDYYDYQLVDGKLAIAIGDVAGKGISAALLMATIQAAMRMELNQQLHATTSPEKYATFFFAIFDQATGLLTYTNAGHLQPVLFREGVATPLDVNGTVVGAFPFSTYEESKLELRSGDLLVCYTDGITEPENEYGEMFGEERLIELVAKNSERDAAQIIECVMERVREWTGVPELSDDMTVLLARKL